MYDIDDSTVRDLENRFTYHAPKGDQTQRYEELRKRAGELARRIVELTPQCGEQAHAIRHLESAIFFANAAIARNE